MAGLIELRDRFDVAVACDPDADRHGIVTRGVGADEPQPLPRHRDRTTCSAARATGRRAPGVGKTLVSSSMIDLVCADLGRRMVEVPVGFKWFVDGLLDGSLGFGGEESAGASFLRRDGAPWSTDKDGILLALLAAEITARTGRDPGAAYAELTERFGTPVYRRDRRARLPRAQGRAGEALGRATSRPTSSPASRSAPCSPRRPATARRSAASRSSPSTAGSRPVRPGTEDIYKLYAESLTRRGAPRTDPRGGPAGRRRRPGGGRAGAMRTPVAPITRTAVRARDMSTDGTGVFTIVLAGGEGKRLAPLTADRAKPAVPFGGHYRLIDFALSNLVNANYRRIVVLTQYKSHSLDRHVSTTWRLSPLLGQLRRPGARPDAPRPALVRRLRRRHLSELQPHQRRAAGAHHRVRRRPHLPHGPAADGRAAHRRAARRSRSPRSAPRSSRPTSSA